jgi:hypothetical protein
MLLQFLGTIGVGLVWGWLAGKVWGKRRPGWPFLLSIIVSSLTVISVVFAYLGWTGAAFFLGAAFLAFLLHLAWLDELRRKLA